MQAFSCEKTKKISAVFFGLEQPFLPPGNELAGPDAAPLFGLVSTTYDAMRRTGLPGAMPS
jgi:hypothetical protein